MDKVNSDTVFDFLNQIYDAKETMNEKIKIKISDGAHYSFKASKKIREFLNKQPLSIKCLCHSLHNLAETIRSSSPNLDVIFSFLKRKIIKNKFNQDLYRRMTGRSIVKLPILIRRGNWLTFAKYVHENYESILRFLIEINDYYIIYLFKKEVFKKELLIASIHSFINNVIIDLKTDNLSTKGQLEKFLLVIKRVKILNKFYVRMVNIFDKNIYLNIFIDIENENVKDIKEDLKYVPLTNATVERNFSKYIHLLSDLKTQLSEKMLSKLLFIYFN